MCSEHRGLQSSEDAHGHRDWQNVRKNNLQNTAKEPEKPTTTTGFDFFKKLSSVEGRVKDLMINVLNSGGKWYIPSQLELMRCAFAGR